MENNLKSFHFQELDWVICFPNKGNEARKYLFYAVDFIDCKTKQAKSKKILADIVDSSTFENAYPHTVGFFRKPVDEYMNVQECYLELRIVRCLEDFWKFLNDLNI